MQLNKLVIQNFMSIKQATLYFDNKGLALVQGINRDPDGADSNGSGKSTMINAILWCNYGVPGKNLAADDVVNDTTQRDCFVESTWFDYDTQITYRITRYRKHREFKNALTLEIKNAGAEWMDATKGTTDLTQTMVNNILGGDISIFKAQCFADQEEALDIPSMTDKELKQLLETTLPFDDLTSCYEIASKSAEEARTAYSTIGLKLHDQEQRISLISSQLSDAKEKSKLRKLNHDIATQELRHEINAQQTNLEAARALFHDEEKLIKARKLLEQKRATIGSHDYHGAMARMQRAIKDSDKAKLALDSFARTTARNCPSCKQVVKGASETAILDDLKDKLADANSELDKYTKEVQAQQKIYEQHQMLIDKENLVDARLNQNNTIKLNISRIEAQINKLNLDLASYKSDPYTTLIEDLEQQLADYQADIPEQKQALAEAKEALDLATETVKLFSPQGVRYHMLETATPELNDKTNYYLSMLTDGAITAIWSTVTKLKSGEYKEKFSIVPYKGSRKGFGSLSGGEKRKVRLACFFALQDMIAERATKNIKLWCADEIDQALDKSGLERLMVLLQEKAKSKGTIVVISHHALQEWIPNVTYVTKENDTSSITGYLTNE